MRSSCRFPCLRLLLGVLAFWLLLPGCARDATETKAVERARAEGLRVGFTIEPPYAFVDSTGDATGESPEVLRTVANALGITSLQWFPLQFNELIPSLESGRIDVVASGLFVTRARQERVRFSIPTACVAPSLVGRAAARSERDADTAASDTTCNECRIAVVDGAVEQAVLQRQLPPNREVIVVPDVATAVTAVRTREADVLAISAPTARLIVRAADLRIDPRQLSSEVAAAARGCAALAFRRQDADLVDAFDAVLAEFVGSPDHARLVRPFGFTRAELETR